MANSSMLVLPIMTAPASAQAACDGGVIGRGEVVQHARAATGLHTPGAEDVLVGERNAGQRPGVTGPEPRIGGMRGRQRLRPR